MLRNLVLLLAFIPVCAAAQMLDVQPGSRIRVVAPGVVAGRLEGTVATRSADSIVVLTSQPAQYHIAIASIRSLSVSQGKSRASGAMKGALWGAGIMTVLSIPLSGDAEMRRTENGGLMGRSQFVAVEGVGGAMIGAVIGAIVGSEKWAMHESPARIAVGPGGAHIGAAFSF